LILVKWRRIHVALVLGIIGLSACLSVAPRLTALGRDQSAYVRVVRTIATDRFGVPHPSGLAFAPGANAFLLADARGAAELVQLSPLAEPLGAIRLPTTLADPLNMAFDGAASRLITMDTAAVELLDFHDSPGRGLAPAAITRSTAQRFGVRRPLGLAFDPASGRLFMLDGAGPAIVRVDPNLAAGAVAGLRDGRAAQVDLRELGVSDLRGLAFNPRDGHLYLLSRARQTLYEITIDGQLVAMRDLGEIRATLSDPQAMVFAPSGDQTDDPAQMSLYVADSRLDDRWQRPGRIVELSFTRPALSATTAAIIQPILVQTIDLSQWSFPSPDPMDITYLPGKNHLLISDSEIEESPRLYWHGFNQFEATLTGSLVATHTTFKVDPVGLSPSNFSAEPSGVAYNPLNGHWIYADDVQERIFDVNLGPDKVFGTSDDSIITFKTKPCGDNDAESVTVDTQRGHLILADGLDSEVYDIAPGPNGIFDGCAPEGDDLATHFDTASLGISDPEAVEYNSDHHTIYVTGAEATKVIETTITGSLVRVFDLSSLDIDSPSGMAYAPSSRYPTVKTLYISARGKDNDSEPDENDGKVYEIALAPLPTPTPTPTPKPPIRHTFLPVVK
jgi:DNA-binding beta-propeller fold protein YncE